MSIHQKYEYDYKVKTFLEWANGDEKEAKTMYSRYKRHRQGHAEYTPRQILKLDPIFGHQTRRPAIKEIHPKSKTDERLEICKFWVSSYYLSLGLCLNERDVNRVYKDRYGRMICLR